MCADTPPEWVLDGHTETASATRAERGLTGGWGYRDAMATAVSS